MKVVCQDMNAPLSGAARSSNAFLFSQNSEVTMGKKDEKNMPRLGKQPPRYRFFLNPYQDARFSTCPQCTNKTKQRKLPLFLHIDPKQPLLLNKTCRYCPYCDLLIAHQDEFN